MLFYNDGRTDRPLMCIVRAKKCAMMPNGIAIAIKMAVSTVAAAVAIPIGMRPNGPNAAAIETAIQSATIAATIAIRMIIIISKMDLNPDRIV